jgi:hypothetical protein
LQAPLLALRGIGARARVEQGEPRHPLGRLQHDLLGDVASHRQPGDGETRWRFGEDRTGDRAHGVVPGVVGNGDIGDVAEARHLWSPQRWRAEKSRHKHKMRFLGHSALPHSALKC